MTEVVAVEPNKLLPVETRTSLSAEAKQMLARISDPMTRQEILSESSKLNNIGNKNSDLLKRTFKSMIEENPKRQELETGMEDMRSAIEKINPERLGRLGFFTRLFTKNPIVAQLKKIKNGYNSAEKEISMVEKALTDGSKYLESDSHELIKLMDNLEAQQKELAKKIFVSKEILAGIKEMDPLAEETVDKEFVFQLEVCLGDMQTMFLVNQQYITSIGLTVNNNTSLCQSLNRVVTVVGNVARTGLAIQSALLQQKNTVALMDSTKEFVANVLTTNSEMVKEGTAKIAQAASSPVLQIDVVKKAYNNLEQAIEDLNRVRNQASVAVQGTLADIDEASTKLKQLTGKVDSYTQA